MDAIRTRIVDGEGVVSWNHLEDHGMEEEMRWSGKSDSNARPRDPQSRALPGCAIARDRAAVVVVGAPGESRTPNFVSLRGRCHAIRRRRLGMGVVVVEGGFEPPVALSCGGFTDRYSVTRSCHSTVVWSARIELATSTSRMWRSTAEPRPERW